MKDIPAVSGTCSKFYQVSMDFTIGLLYLGSHFTSLQAHLEFDQHFINYFIEFQDQLVFKVWLCSDIRLLSLDSDSEHSMVWTVPQRLQTVPTKPHPHFQVFISDISDDIS